MVINNLAIRSSYTHIKKEYVSVNQGQPPFRFAFVSVKTRILGLAAMVSLVGGIGAAVVINGIPPVLASSGTPLFTEAFAGASVTNSNWTTGGTFQPCLTASQNTSQTPIPGCAPGQPSLPAGGDPSGSGALRLTSNTKGKVGYVLYNQALPTQAGLVVTFDEYQYNGTGNADGISFFTTNGAYNLTAPGQFGGYLGYAGGHSAVGTGPGVANGLFGVGLDAYGNYANFQNSGCPSYSPSRIPQEVGVRGPGNASETGYCWLGGTGTLSQGISNATDTLRTQTGAGREVQVTVDPPSYTNPQIHVSINFGSGLVNVLNVPEPAMPPTFKFGFASSTGGFTDIHEINAMSIATVLPLAPEWSATATPVSALIAGVPNSYTLQATSSNAWGPESAPVTVNYQLPASGVTFNGTATGTGWACSNSTSGSGPYVACTYTPASSLLPGTALPPITVPVNVSSASSGSVGNAVLNVNSSDNEVSGGSSTTIPLVIDPQAQNYAMTVVSGQSTYSGTLPTPYGTGPFTYTQTGVEQGSWTINSNGTFIFDNFPSTYSGTPFAHYQVTDSFGDKSNVANVNLTINPLGGGAITAVDNAPGGVTMAIPAPTGTGPFTYQLASTPPASDGSATISGSNIVFTPVFGFQGTVPTFNYTATDAYGDKSAPESVSVKVVPPSAPSGLESGVANAGYNTTTTIPLTDPASGTGPYTWALTSPYLAAGDGAVSINPSTGVLTYNSPTGFSDYTNTFAYQVTDAYGQTSTSTFGFFVAPTTPNITGSGVGPKPFTTDLPSASGGSAPFTYALKTTPPSSDGVATINGMTGAVTFAPANAFFGSVPEFTYTATDAGGFSASGSVNLTVNLPNAPTIGDVSAVTLVGQTTTVPLSATGAGPFTWSVSTPPGATWGVASIINGDVLQFVPAPGVSGIVPTFQITGTDQYGRAATGTANISILPVAQAGSGTAKALTTTSVQLPAPSGSGPFTYSLVISSLPAARYGTMTINSATGVVTFAPTAAADGLKFVVQYIVTDGSGLESSPANLSVQVLAAATTIGLPDTGAPSGGGGANLVWLLLASTIMLVVGMEYAIRKRFAH